jgi:hypothetical protein
MLTWLYLRRGLCTSYPPPAPETIADCPTYDDYRYGLQNLAAYSFVEPLGPMGLMANYRARAVVVLLGERDDDPEADNLARGCRASLQGRHRLERGLVYRAHLIDEFGEVGRAYPFATIPGVGHSSTEMFQSACGLRYIFDVGDETSCPALAR